MQKILLRILFWIFFDNLSLVGSKEKTNQFTSNNEAVQFKQIQQIHTNGKFWDCSQSTVETKLFVNKPFAKPYIDCHYTYLMEWKLPFCDVLEHNIRGMKIKNQQFERTTICQVLLHISWLYHCYDTTLRINRQWIACKKFY